MPLRGGLADELGIGRGRKMQDLRASRAAPVPAAGPEPATAADFRIPADVP
jgi:hypothetical protein